MANLADVAREAGVSASLASRILNGHPATRAKVETRERVIRVAAELGYKANHAGRALRLSRSDAVAFVAQDITNPIFADMVRGIEDAAADLGDTLLLARSERMQRDGNLIESLVQQRRVDGFLVQRRDDLDDESLAAMLPGEAKIVLVNSRLPGRPGSVVADDVTATALATRHLLELGHSRIALVNGPPTTDTSVRREHGFRDGLVGSGVRATDVAITRIGYSPAAGREAIAELLVNGRPRPTGVVAANVNTSYGVLAGARLAGLRVPEDLSIIAVHDAWPAEYMWPPITTVRSPYYDLGRRAVGLLDEIMKGAAPSDEVVTDPPLVLEKRGSTGPPSGGSENSH